MAVKGRFGLFAVNFQKQVFNNDFCFVMGNGSGF